MLFLFFCLVFFPLVCVCATRATIPFKLINIGWFPFCSSQPEWLKHSIINCWLYCQCCYFSSFLLLLLLLLASLSCFVLYVFSVCTQISSAHKRASIAYTTQTDRDGRAMRCVAVVVVVLVNLREQKKGTGRKRTKRNGTTTFELGAMHKRRRFCCCCCFVCWANARSHCNGGSCVCCVCVCVCACQAVCVCVWAYDDFCFRFSSIVLYLTQLSESLYGQIYAFVCNKQISHNHTDAHSFALVRCQVSAPSCGYKWFFSNRHSERAPTSCQIDCRMKFSNFSWSEWSRSALVHEKCMLNSE